MAFPGADDTLNIVNLVTQCLCIPICTIFVALRLGIRVHYRQVLHVEDTFCILAWALFMGYCGIAIVVGKYGGGYHHWEVPDDQEMMFRKLCYIATAVYCPMALFVKIALLSILIRIFAPYRSKIIFIYALLAALCVYYTVAEIVKIRMCDPVPAYWNLSLRPTASCLDQQAALLADSVISVVTDLIILILPLPLTWALQMPRGKKLRVVGMLSAGGLATGFSIYRLVLVIRQGSSKDMTVVFTCVILSGNAEGGVALICACLPTVNFFVRKVRDAAGSYGYSSNRYYHHSGSGPVQLGKVRNAAASDGTEFGSDERHLISYAGAADGNGSGSLAMNGDGGDGIHKTVDVSQTVEVMGEGDEGGKQRQRRY